MQREVSFVPRFSIVGFSGLHSAADFWEPKTLEEHIQAQQTRPMMSIAIKADFWPKDESADDFIDYIYGQRREDRSS